MVCLRGCGFAFTLHVGDAGQGRIFARPPDLEARPSPVPSDSHQCLHILLRCLSGSGHSLLGTNNRKVFLKGTQSRGPQRCFAVCSLQA